MADLTPRNPVLFDMLVEGESDVMHYKVSRAVDPRVAGMESADGVSISEDAMRELFAAIETFIGARLYARMRAGEGPVTMNVGVDIKFDEWSDD